MRAKLNYHSTRILFTLALFVMPLINAMAQDEDDPFADDVFDVPSAPINNYLIIGIITGICIALRFFHSQQLLKITKSK